MSDKTVKFVNDHYEVQLPLKRHWKEIINNFNVSKQRLEGLKRKIHQNLKLFSQYSEIITDYFKHGIIEQVQ